MSVLEIFKNDASKKTDSFYMNNDTFINLMGIIYSLSVCFFNSQ